VNRQRVSRISRSLTVPRPLKVVEDLEHAHALDRPARSLTGTVARLLPPGRLKDLLHGVPLGHPAHPPLTDVPVGCWMAAAALDLFPDTGRACQVLLAAGLAGAVPVALTGTADWASLHIEQQRVGIVHSIGTTAATGLFAASLVARLRGRGRQGKVLSLAGLVALFGGTYLGRHLAFRLGAGASHAESITHLGPLGWHDLCPLDELPEGWPVHRSLGYISLFVLRYGDDVNVLADRCAHLDGPLHQGRMVRVDDEICVICPWHGSTFQVSDGTVVHGPATGRQPAFETRVLESGMIQVRPAR
jgi:nitrite reductase/ring-hydroxylating ferredoxin subunit